MIYVTLLIGLLFFAIGFIVLLKPGRFRTFLSTMTRRRISAASVFRLMIGILLVLAAPETRAPIVVTFFGILFILSGILIPVMGMATSEAVAAWWVKRSDSLLRVWALATMALGAVLVWLGWT